METITSDILIVGAGGAGLRAGIGRPPAQLVLDLRLRRAREMLEGTHEPIAAVAVLAGVTEALLAWAGAPEDGPDGGLAEALGGACDVLAVRR